MNIAFVRGRLSSAPRLSDLESGDVLIRYEVTVARDDAAPDTVPVAWIGSPDHQPPPFDAGDEVAVAGRVRRRFWRAPAATRSSTEVVADAVVAATDRRRLRALARRTAAALASPP